MKDQQPQGDLEAMLRNAGDAVDNGAPDAAIELPSLDKTSDTEASETHKTADTTKQDSTNVDDPAKKQKVKSDKSETKTPEQKALDDKANADDPNDSKFTKAKKDAERKDRSWKALEAEKEATRKREEELIAREKAIKEREEKTSKPSDEEQNRLEAAATKYDQAAKDFDNEGREDMAEACREKAKAIRKVAEQKKEEFVTAKKKEFEDRWDGNLQKLQDENPDLKDPKSSLYNRVEHILAQKPFLRSHPDGIVDAVTVCKMKMETERLGALVPDLQTKLTAAQARIKELEESTQIPGAGASERGRATKDFNQMTADEQGEHLRREALAADEG
jgi:hypothetical protein